ELGTWCGRIIIVCYSCGYKHAVPVKLKIKFSAAMFTMQQGATISFVWSTPEVFAAFVKWPGVSPYLPEEAAHQNDIEVGDNNAQDGGEHGA
ncbi:hypothetical protein L195_g059092, partial [Trifolium pratense]